MGCHAMLGLLSPPADTVSAMTNPFFAPSPLPHGLPDFAAIADADYAEAFERGIADHEREIEAIVSNPAPPTFEEHARRARVERRDPPARRGGGSSPSPRGRDRVDPADRGDLGAEALGAYRPDRPERHPLRAGRAVRETMGSSAEGDRTAEQRYLVERWHTEMTLAGARTRCGRRRGGSRPSTIGSPSSRRSSISCSSPMRTSSPSSSTRPPSSTGSATRRSPRRPRRRPSADSTGSTSCRSCSRPGTRGSRSSPTSKSAVASCGPRASAAPTAASTTRGRHCSRSSGCGRSARASSASRATPRRSPPTRPPAPPRRSPRCSAGSHPPPPRTRAPSRPRSCGSPARAGSARPTGRTGPRGSRGRVRHRHRRAPTPGSRPSACSATACSGPRRSSTVTFTLRPELVGWKPDVRVYEVKDEDGTPVGLYLLDLYARPTKRGGAWMNSITTAAKLLGIDTVVVTKQHSTSRSPPPASRPLLTFDEVGTLFHEFGHALHGLFAARRTRSSPGRRTSATSSSSRRR